MPLLASGAAGGFRQPLVQPLSSSSQSRPPRRPIRGPNPNGMYVGGFDDYWMRFIPGAAHRVEYEVKSGKGKSPRVGEHATKGYEVSERPSLKYKGEDYHKILMTFDNTDYDDERSSDHQSHKVVFKGDKDEKANLYFDKRSGYEFYVSADSKKVLCKEAKLPSVEVTVEGQKKMSYTDKGDTGYVLLKQSSK
ncbi:hypothetical protein FOL47_005099 [Perkinsus chesapeaki]|uniref:Uncharacterized protein n=1 Tax=Perkinsus chesapeaki TaxID=330153 RepID=A0A7J6LYW1_PERCH|nr:hypothetical protein FOL47_005099 [Perkinsus chesapeaki]